MSEPTSLVIAGLELFALLIHWVLVIILAPDYLERLRWKGKSTGGAIVRTTKQGLRMDWTAFRKAAALVYLDIKAAEFERQNRTIVLGGLVVWAAGAVLVIIGGLMPRPAAVDGREYAEGMRHLAEAGLAVSSIPFILTALRVVSLYSAVAELERLTKSK